MNSDGDSGDVVSFKSGNKNNKPSTMINSDADDLQDYEDEDMENNDDMFDSFVADDDDDYGDGDNFEGDFDDFDDQAVGEDENECYDDLTQQKSLKVYETKFKVLTANELHKKQQNKVDHVASFLSVTPSQAKALLWSYKWQADTLIEAYIENSSKILEKAGLYVDASGNPVSKAPYHVTEAPAGYTCFICCEDSDSFSKKPFLIFELECGHSLCVDCFRAYIRQKVAEEGESRGIKCPQYKCPVLIPENAVKYLFTQSEDKTNLSEPLKASMEDDDPSDQSLFAKYEQFLDKAFVAEMEKDTFCPAPDCQNIIELANLLQDENKKVPSVACTCGKKFCFSCGLDDHMPATCTVAKAWLKKCRDDSETSNWIAANTQECNKCHSTIEKNGGCNHMTCKKCKHEFCWICMGDWSLHGNSYYNCSRYDEKDAQIARTEQDKSRASLKRYLHYYNRYMNHIHSLKLDSETFAQMQVKMKQMQESAGMSWIEVQFLSMAFETLSLSRRTLTWTYAFAFYLQKTHRTLIFEDNQNDLEVAVEQLSELFEKPANDLAALKVQLLDKSQYVRNRRIVLLEDAAQGLLEGAWEYLPLS